MGEQIYDIAGLDVSFCDMDETYRCLCTFPGNDQVLGIDIERVRSLALLGAVVVLEHNGMLDDSQNHLYLPECIPDWIKEQIDKAIGYKQCKTTITANNHTTVTTT